MATGRVTNRQCGTCTACCTALGVPSIDKAAGERCTNLLAGRCSIYAECPSECRAFNCLWLQGAVPNEMRPDKIKAVLSTNTSGDIILVIVQPANRGAHRKGVLARWIEGVARKGGSIIVVCGDDRHYFGPVADQAKDIRTRLTQITPR